MEEQTERVGGGSGGGRGLSDSAGASGAYQIQANQVEVISQPPMFPATPGPCIITLLAAGTIPQDGRVDVHGNKGVRITSGPTCVPPVSSEATNGVEIIVADEPPQTVTLQCGPVPGVSPTVALTPDGITIDAGTGQLTLKSLTQITLSVAEGLSTITLTPEGIIIKGVLVQIN